MSRLRISRVDPPTEQRNKPLDQERHNDHRDANAAFSLSERVMPIGGVAQESESLRSVLLVGPFLGTEAQQCA
jgi:hypothetical protein